MKRVNSRLSVPPPRRAPGKEKALSLLNQEPQVTLSQLDFAAFNTAIAGAFAPNESLQKVAKVPRA